MAVATPVGDVIAPNDMSAFQGDVKNMQKDTEAESVDAIQGKGEVQDGKGVKNDVKEKGLGADVDIFL